MRIYKIAFNNRSTSIENRIKTMHYEPEQFTHKEMLEIYYEFNPQWFLENNVGEASKDQLLGLARRYTERFEMNSGPTPKKREVLPSGQYNWSDALSAILEGNIDAINSELHSKGVLGPHEIVVELKYDGDEVIPSLIVEKPDVGNVIEFPIS